MFDKRNIKYIVILCVCFALTLTLFILSFFLDRFFHVKSAGSCTEYEGIISEIDASDADMVSLKVVSVQVWDSTQANKTKASSEGVSCTVQVLKRDMIEGEETKLAEGVDIVFLSELPGRELKEGVTLQALALNVREEKEGEEGKEDKPVATLDLHNKPAKKKAQYTQIGMFCGVVFFFVGGGFCMLRLCGIGSKKTRW